MNRDKMASFLSSLRKEKVLKQQDIAEIFNVSPQAVSKWEKGESIPDIEILEKISSFYDVSIEEILNGEKSFETVNRTETIEVRNVKETLEDASPDKMTMGRLIHILLGGLFIVFTFSFFFLPYFTDGYFYFDGYHILGSPNYKGGNVILLLIYIASYALGIIEIIDGSLSKKYKGLIYSRNFLFIFIVGGYSGMLNPLLLNENSAAGGILLTLLSIGYYIANIFIPSYKAELNLLSSKYDIREVNIDTLMSIIIISTLVMSTELIVNGSIIILILTVLFALLLIAFDIVSLTSHLNQIKLKKTKISLLSVLVVFNIVMIYLVNSFFTNNAPAILTVDLLVMVIFQLFSILYYYLYFKKHNQE